MKIFIIFSFYLLSGPVSCFDVIGYPGGSVLIYCRHDEYKKSDAYFCKEIPNECVYLNPKTEQNNFTERVFLLKAHGGLIVTFRNLRLEDSGSYQCGQTGVRSQTVNLKINTDPCCLSPRTVTADLGKTITIKCLYPEQFKLWMPKSFYKLYGQYVSQIINTEIQQDRFFISDDRRSKVLSVDISDVREDDEGVYFCGAGNGSGSVYYFSLFKEIQLQVTESSSITIIIIIIITVSVCVVLLLVGGSTLICYKWRNNRTQSFTSSPDMTMMGNINKTDADYENDSPGNQNIPMSAVYQSLNPNTNQSDSVYQSLNPNTNQSDSVYQSLNPNTNRSDSVYQSLNPNTSQSDSVYESLDPRSKEPDSVYYSLKSKTS